MEKVKITFLGTGNAIPTKTRNHTAILLGYKNENILVDCGEGTQRQLRFIGISPTKITKILITHWHGDHILGIPGLLQTLAMSNYSKVLEIYGPKGTLSNISLIQGLIKRFNIKIKVNEILYDKFINTPDYYIEARPMLHDTPTFAYSFIIKDKFRIRKDKLRKLKLPNSPLLKQLQQGKDIMLNSKKIKASSLTYLEKGRKVTFILDTLFNNNAIEIARNSDLLISESSFTKADEKIARDYKHLTSEQAAVIAKKSKSKRLFLTHISQRYDSKPEIIEKEAKKIFKNTKVAKDFDVITI